MESKRKIIIHDDKSRLGNRLLTFAHFIGFAKENNLIVYNPTFCKYSGLFESTSVNVLSRYPRRLFFRHAFVGDFFAWLTAKIVSFVEKGSILQKYFQVIDIGLDKVMRLDSPEFRESLSGRGYLICSGWQFRASETLRKHSDKIREYFTLAPENRRNVKEFMEKIDRQNTVLAGVHIRHTDYKTYLDGKYYYEIKQYVRFMKDVENLFPDKKVLFLICSDTKLESAHFNEFNFAFGLGGMVEDMYTFAECDYLIGPPSTYTMWASYYGQVPLYRVYDADEPMSLDKFRIFG